MEPLLKKLSVLRRGLTTSINKVQEALESGADTTTLRSLHHAAASSAEKLFDCESAVLDAKVSTKDYSDEQAIADYDVTLRYREKWAFCQIKFEERLKEEADEKASLLSAQSCLQSGKSKLALKLPKLQLIKFDGNIKGWVQFWGQFRKIHDDDTMENSDKFQYLIQAMTPGSPSKRLVESYPPSGDNYPKAIEALKTRFARDELLIDAYVRGLIELMKKQPDNITELYDQLQTHLQALETLGVTKDKYAAILFPMVESALPEDILRTWNRYQPSDTIKNLEGLVNFLKSEVESEERILIAKQERLEISGPKTPTACFIAGTSRRSETPDFPVEPKKNLQVCFWCDKDTHTSNECFKAIKMTPKERQKFVEKKKACQYCLRTNHVAKRCKYFPKCIACKKRHLTIMCPDIGTPAAAPAPASSNNLLCKANEASVTLLQTLMVKVTYRNNCVTARAIIDTGAQRSYIKTSLAIKLGLEPIRKEALTQCLFGGREMKAEEYDVYDVNLRSTESSFTVNLSVLGQAEICGLLPKIRSSAVIDQLKQKGVVLTDTPDSPDEVTLLIGADFSGRLLTGDIIHLDNNLTAVRTKLGWTVQGPITGVYSSIVNTITTLHCLTKLNVSDLWTLEAIGIKDPAEQSTKAQQELHVLEKFEKTIKVNEEGRYEVALPWHDVPRPQTNYELAKKRLHSTMQRLHQLGKLEQYDAVFKEWLSLNIIEVAPDQHVVGHYMPHHAVVKESSLTTKIRPVFDASAKDQYGTSLNACLEKGTNLLEQIPQLLISFRKEAIGVTADIAKAFLQISLAPEDRDYLRFLWWANLDERDEPPITFRHRRVVFGVASSPFHLIATVNHHLDRCPEHLKETAQKLKRSYYVDNCVTSVKTKEEMEKFIIEAKEVMSIGKFDLRGWVTGPARVDDTETLSVLGVVWNTRKDDLACNVNSLMIKDEKLSKRTLLSVTQRVFDPIGITCATTIVPKMIIQKAWNEKLTWDEELPNNLTTEFKAWLDQAHLINECKIPRRLTSYPIDECQNSLHVFCDASKEAYATCIFLRSKYNEHVEVRLVLAKARVTPLKKISVPRLELIAATLGSRLATTVIKSLDIKEYTVNYWSDSSVVLTWIKGEGVWSVFVTNRVKEIRGATPTEAWKHVPGHLNPADLPSRGTCPKTLLESRWWEGPDWLKLDEIDWPTAEVTDIPEDRHLERRTRVALITTQDYFLDKLGYFSTYTKIVRMIGWMLRIKLKPKPVMKELTCKEFEQAEKALTKLIQQKYLRDIQGDTKLTIFTDQAGIIRLETKLGLGHESKDFKYPIVLPGSEPIVQRMVHQRHVLMQHAGAQTLMRELREKFWIIGLRKVSKKVVQNCMRCRRFKAKSVHPPIGSLPEGRMETGTAFEVSGVDLAGPLTLKDGSKAWIVLFTCATYRAVHLETVESLSTSTFIMSLRRFIARRGRVTCIYSDNATNFHGLDNALNKLDWDEVLRYSTIAKIEWKFIPPSAPWWGGFYERLIGVLKAMLRRVLGKAAVTLVELQTVLCDCEDVINSRPLTYISNQVDELAPLTPSSFTRPILPSAVPDLDMVDEKWLNARANYCQKLRDDFRQRFRSEYLGALTQKRSQRSAELQVGDIVIVESEEKRVNWPLAVVEEVVRGADGHHRVAHIRTSQGQLLRPLQKLYPLEVRPDKSKRTRCGRPVVVPQRYYS